MQTQTQHKTKHKSKSNGVPARKKVDPHEHQLNAEAAERLRLNGSYGKYLRIAGGAYTPVDPRWGVNEEYDVEETNAAFLFMPQCSFVPEFVHLFGPKEQTLFLGSVLHCGQPTLLELTPKPAVAGALRSYRVCGVISAGIGDMLVAQGENLAPKHRHAVAVTGKAATATGHIGSAVIGSGRCALPGHPKRYWEAEFKKGEKTPHYSGMPNCRSYMPFAGSLASVEIRTNAKPGELEVTNVIAGTQPLMLDATAVPVELFVQPMGLRLESAELAPMQHVSVSVNRAARLGTKRVWYEVDFYFSLARPQ